MAQPLKVLINAQIPPGGECGGIEQFTMGLVYALGQLTDGDEEYTLITRHDTPDWLRPFMGPNQRAVAAPAPPKGGRADRLKRLLGPMRPAAGALKYRMLRFFHLASDQDARGDFCDSLGGHIIHFPSQEFIRCSIPCIYNPWDLQHLHYPQFYTSGVLAWRNSTYPRGCAAASAVVAGSRVVRSDLERQFGLDPKKVYVIHCAPPSSIYGPVTDEVLRDVRERYHLPELFGFYPAQTWPAKNHPRLLEAVRQVRDRNQVILNIVCTGRKNEHWPPISRRIDEFGLGTQVTFLGFVEPRELRALCRLAQFLVFPSLFEGAGLPVIEAFEEGVPVTCSDIPPLREYGGDAVLTFDPYSTEGVAESLLRLSADNRLRDELRDRGRERAKLFTWERTGKAYRALYRKVAGTPMTDEDRLLLAGECGMTASS